MLVRVWCIWLTVAVLLAWLSVDVCLCLFPPAHRSPSCELCVLYRRELSKTLPSAWPKFHIFVYGGYECPALLWLMSVPLRSSTLPVVGELSQMGSGHSMYIKLQAAGSSSSLSLMTRTGDTTDNLLQQQREDGMSWTPEVVGNCCLIHTRSIALWADIV